jgi:hypothetical protein
MVGVRVFLLSNGAGSNEYALRGVAVPCGCVSPLPPLGSVSENTKGDFSLFQICFFNPCYASVRLIFSEKT